MALQKIMKNIFYKQLQKYITEEDIILGGDFNMVEDPLLDRQGGNPYITHTLGLLSLINKNII